MLMQQQIQREMRGLVMGERTQMLVRVIVNGKEVVSRSLHYQWGFGRVMLLDAFSQGWNFQLKTWYEVRDAHVARLANVIVHHCIGGVANFDYKDKRWLNDVGIVRYHETLQQMFEVSDNNDGYAELTIRYAKDEGMPVTTQATLKLYNHERKHVNLTRYIREGNGQDFADAAFRRHYRALLQSVGVELIEPTTAKKAKDTADQTEKTA